MFLALLCLAATTPTNAQGLMPGDRVRFQVPCQIGERCPTLTGTLVSRSTNNLVFLVGDTATVQVSLAPESTVQVLRGTHRNTLAGFAIGTAIGLGFGVLMANDCNGRAYALCDLAYPAGAAIGALGGLVAGSLTTTERWVTVSGLDIALRPHRGALQLGMRLNW